MAAGVTTVSPYLIPGAIFFVAAMALVLNRFRRRRRSRNRRAPSPAPSPAPASAPPETAQAEVATAHVILNMKPISPPQGTYDDLASFKVDAKLADTPCAICLDPFGDADVTAGNCLHKFHTVCIKSWLKKDKNGSCPVCRESFLGEEDLNEIDEVQPTPSAPPLVLVDGYQVSLEIPPTPSTPSTPPTPLSPRSTSPGSSTEYQFAQAYFTHPAMPPLVFPQSRRCPHNHIHPCMHPVGRFYAAPPRY